MAFQWQLSKRLEKGRFVWRSTKDGKIALIPARLAMPPEGRKGSENDPRESFFRMQVAAASADIAAFDSGMKPQVLQLLDSRKDLLVRDRHRRDDGKAEPARGSPGRQAEAKANSGLHSVHGYRTHAPARGVRLATVHLDRCRANSHPGARSAPIAAANCADPAKM